MHDDLAIFYQPEIISGGTSLYAEKQTLAEVGTQPISPQCWLQVEYLIEILCYIKD